MFLCPAVQELARFNALLSVMRSSLVSLQQACKGLALMSTLLHQLGRSLFDGKVGTRERVQPCGACLHVSASDMHLCAGGSRGTVAATIWVYALHTQTVPAAGPPMSST